MANDDQGSFSLVLGRGNTEFRFGETEFRIGTTNPDLLITAGETNPDLTWHDVLEIHKPREPDVPDGHELTSAQVQALSMVVDAERAARIVEGAPFRFVWRRGVGVVVEVDDG